MNSNKRNKLILFDWGNIVESHTTGYSNIKAWNDLFIECGYKGEDIGPKNLYKYRITAISNVKEFKNVYYKIAKEFKLTATYEEFVKAYDKIFNRIDYYKDVRDYEISLKDKAYIGILSNLTIFDKERLDNQVNLSNYDYVFLSFEMECKKPDLEIFEKVQKQVQFEKENILFIDDRTDNIETAKSFGWNVLQATGLELDKIKEYCKNFLNSI